MGQDKEYVETPAGIHGGVVQVLAPDVAVPKKITVAVASARVALPAGSVMRIASDVDCYFRFGDNTVVATATDSFFPAGVEYFHVPNTTLNIPATDIAAIRATTDGIMTITKMG